MANSHPPPTITTIPTTITSTATNTHYYTERRGFSTTVSNAAKSTIVFLLFQKIRTSKGKSNTDYHPKN